MDKNDDIGHGGLEDDGQSFKETTDSNKFSIPQKLNTVCSSKGHILLKNSKTRDRIICSTIISRQGLNKKDQEDRELSKDEDEAFYATLKSKIQTGLSANNNFAKSMMGNCRLEKKRKNCFNDTSEHIMKKFKENMKHRKSNIQENRSVAIGSSIENLECNDKSTAEKVGKPLCEQDKNKLIPTNKNIGIESNSSNKLLAKVTSSIGTDECILSSYIEKTTITAKEVTEYYFDLQCVTQPPNKSGYET